MGNMCGTSEDDPVQDPNDPTAVDPTATSKKKKGGKSGNGSKKKKKGPKDSIDFSNPVSEIDDDDADWAKGACPRSVLVALHRCLRRQHRLSLLRETRPALITTRSLIKRSALIDSQRWRNSSSTRARPPAERVITWGWKTAKPPGRGFGRSAGDSACDSGSARHHAGRLKG